MGKALVSKQILVTNSLRKCMEISLENLDLDIIGAEKVNKLAWPPCHVVGNGEYGQLD